MEGEGENISKSVSLFGAEWGQRVVFFFLPDSP